MLQMVATITQPFLTWERLVLPTREAWRKLIRFPATNCLMLGLCSTRYSDGRRSDHTLFTA